MNSLKFSDREQIRTRVEFVVSGLHTPPDEITVTLGIAPDSVWRIGDPLTSRQGVPIGTARENRWALSSGSRIASDTLGDHLRVLLDLILPHSEAVRCLAATDRAWFWIFWESDAMFRGTGAIIAAEICHDIGILGVELDFDLYCSLPHAAESEL
jgi:hypothetical protein